MLNVLLGKPEAARGNSTNARCGAYISGKGKFKKVLVKCQDRMLMALRLNRDNGGWFMFGLFSLSSLQKHSVNCDVLFYSTEESAFLLLTPS